MNKKLKKILVKQHREVMYDRAMQKKIDAVKNNSGEDLPHSYIDERWKKLKEVKG